MKAGCLLPRLAGAVCLLGLLSLAAVLQAQTPAPAPQQNTQPAPEPIPLFRTQANLVLVDVVVRDHGQPVHGLKAEDFHLFEDSAEQKITVFEEHRSTDAIETSGPPPNLPPDTYSDAPRYALTSAANVILLDALNTPLTDQVYVRRRMLAYLKSIPPGTRIAVFTLGSHLRVIEGFAADPSVLEKALTEGRGHPETSPVMDPMFDQTMTDAADFAGSGMLEFAAETQDFEWHMRREMTIDALTQLARYLSTIPGRKNLMWFTGSFPFQVSLGGSQTTNFVSDFEDQVKKLEELLTLARVAVYPIDALGLIGVPSTSAETTVMPPGLLNSTGSIPTSIAPSAAGPQRINTASKLESQDRAFLASLAASHGAMDLFAKSTGGKAYYNSNAIGSAVGDAIAIGSNYYTLAYTPQNQNYNGDFRAVAVKLPEHQYELAYRPGYYAQDPIRAAKLIPGRLSPLVAAMQHGVLPLSQVPFTVKVTPASSDPAAAQNANGANAGGMLSGKLKSPVTRYSAEFTIDAAGIDFRPLGDGKNHREIELSQALYNYNDAGLAVDTPAAMDSNPQARIRLTQQIDVPRGQTYLRIGVHDLMSGRIGTLEIPLNGSK
jgi:VWFA-related protein